jgi:hypothetical protein
VELVLVCGLSPTVTELTFGDVQAVGDAVGPHTAKVTLPVGAPPPALPVTVAVSTEELPRGTLGLPRAVVNVGVVLVGAVVVTSRHSVAVSLSVADV